MTNSRPPGANGEGEPRPTDNTPNASDAMLQHLISEQNARELSAAAAAQRGTAMRDGVRAAELIAYANRGQGAPVDFRIERSIRSDAKVASTYRRILMGAAVGYSEMAMAAGTGNYPSRKIGDFDLKVVEDGDDVYVVLSEARGAKVSPTMLEAIGPADCVRIPLSQPVRGHIQISIDPANGELARLLALLGQPATELYLI